MINLRSTTIELINSGVIQDKLDKVLTLCADGAGEILIVPQGDEIHINYITHNRLFVLGKDKTLVERVCAVPDKKILTQYSDTEKTFLDIIMFSTYSSKQGETIPIPYGDDESICLVTRTMYGIIGEFISNGTKLFYDLRNRKIRPYTESKATSPRREARLTVEKEQLEDKGTDLVDQHDYDGSIEQVDRNVYKNKMVCKCGNVRWVKNSDTFQVHSCKPCTKKYRGSGRVRKQS